MVILNIYEIDNQRFNTFYYNFNASLEREVNDYY
jgi:hypothetical protein